MASKVRGLYEWLQNNAERYGFVNSYPQGMEHVTGFRAEAWHWRYVGTPVATSVQTSGLTLGVFLDTYKDKFLHVTDSVQNKVSAWLSRVIVLVG